jgi:phospholipid/cholesterol/gamma-HCH transport system substrate-binding protein
MGGGINEVISKVDNTVEKAGTIIKNIKEGQGVLGSLLAEGSAEDTAITAIVTNLRAITDEAKTATLKLNENMEALKHNWLFKSYFEDRGYWDAEEYEKEIDEKTQELNKKIDLLDEKIKELKSLETKSNK